MANIKISALPSYTGTAADLRWFVMNNSGETETFKYSGYSSPFKSVGTNNTNNIYDTNAMGGSFSSIVAGENNTISSSRNFIGGGINNTIASSTDSVIVGSYDSIIRAVGRNGIYSSFQGDITQSPNYQSVIMASAYSNIAWGNASAIIGGYYNIINGTSNNESIIIGGQSNTLTSTLDGTILNGVSNSLISSNKSSIIGGESNTLNTAGYGFIGGGKYNILSGGTNYSSIIGGLSNENYGNYSGIFNGTLNKINNTATEHSTIIGAYSSQTEGDYSHIFGGLYNQIFNEEAVILGGQYNIISAGASQAEIIGSRNCIINGATVDNTIINSISSIIPNGIDRAVMLGTSGRTATVDSATFVENLVVFNYAGLDFANDTAAAAGGVVLGQIYHTAGVMKIRIV